MNPATGSELPTVTELITPLTDVDDRGVYFEDEFTSWRDHIRYGAAIAAALKARLDPARPQHVGVLLQNTPFFSALLVAAGLSGIVPVGLNPIRRGAALARDIAHADCQLVLADSATLATVGDVDSVNVDSPEWADEVASHRDTAVSAQTAAPSDIFMLIYTSGTSGDPKAVICSQGKVAIAGEMMTQRFGLGSGDVCYVSMPLFHSNAVLVGWSVALASRSSLALRRKFSASQFLPDIRRYGATYANYVGKPLSYVLATPERADDADNPLRIAYGNEGAPADLARFAERFGCTVIDGFGSTEGGVAISRTPGTPPGALGKLADGVAILHPETGRPCPPASFGPGGELLNPAEAVGELVNTSGPGLFAGYYDDAEADASRIRDGMYWSGDLGYADSDGFCWFAGRAGQWLRVDGENLGTAPIERALLRHPAIAEAAVYGVPDPVAGDQVMACVVVRGGASLTPAELGAFLAAQGDIGGKQHPRFVRVADAMPRTATFKVLTRVLAAERWNAGDPVWWRPDVRAPVFVPLGPRQAAALDTGIRAGR